MLRVYCPTGPDTLMQNAVYLGGHVDCLGTDTTGGCFAILGAADASQIAYIQTLGVTVIPNNMAAPIPTAIPTDAYTTATDTSTSGTTGALAPVGSVSGTTTTITPSTVDDLMQAIYANNPLPAWHPDFV